MFRRRLINFLRPIACIFLATLTIFGATIPAYAVSETRRQIFAENNIVFYDPEGDGSTNCNPTTTKPTGDQITWIGDSYSVGAQSIIESKLPGVDFGPSINDSSSYIQVSKNVASGTNDNPAGLTILQNLISENKLRKYVVFALGTNNKWSSTSIDTIKSLVSSDTQVILVTSQTKATGADGYTASNQLIKDLASSESNFHIADWTTVYDDKYFESDTIHPNSNGGYTAWVNVIYDALPGGTSGGTTPGTVSGNDNREKAWNYFVTAGISGVSDSAEVIAGIMGNFSQESGFNPFSHTSGSAYYGIFQTPALKDILNAKGWSQYWGKSINEVPSDINDEALKIELDYLVTEHWSWHYFADNVGNTNYVTNTSGEAGAVSYSELFLTAVERAVGGTEELTDSNVKNNFVHSNYPSQYWNTKWQGVTGRNNAAKEAFNALSGSTGSGSGGSGGGTCSPSGDTGGDVVISDGYAFPLMGATKSNYLNPGYPGTAGDSVLSRIPCGSGSCHHDYNAVDMGLRKKMIDGHEYTESDFNEGYSDMYYYSMGVGVVAFTSGKITNYKTYSRSAGNYQDKCGSLSYLGDDGNQYWMGHILYEPDKYKAGDTFQAGDRIGTVGYPQCACGTQSHLHIDIQGPTKYDHFVITMMDKLWEKLPE